MSNIGALLELIQRLANDHLQAIDPRHEEWVKLGDSDRLDDDLRDAVVLTLYNITRENPVAGQAFGRTGADRAALVAPPLHIDLHVMFMANFRGRNYREGLGAISRIISYFQQNPILDHGKTPQLEPQIDRVSIELLSLDSAELNQVMGALGATYLPSAFYKLRMLPFASP